jgi:hypothetical protein
MKFIEVSGGWLQPVSNDENIIVERVRGHDGPLPKAVLDEHEQELARNLVYRGILTRFVYEGNLCFAVNDLEDLWEN